MALGYTSSSPLTYQAFLETSFGYGTTELQNLPNSPFTSPTDYVKIIITASLHWDDNGHISTPEVGTAIPVYNKENATWFVDGERDDVNAVLNQLKFYPTIHQDTLDWSPDVTRPNATSGTYLTDVPPTIPTTYMSMSIYQTSGLFVSYDIYVEAEPVTYSNKRPYFSAYGTGFDLASAAYDTITGATLDLGTVEDGDDGDNLEVKCEFLTYNNTAYPGTAFGEFVGHNELYIGDKKPQTPNTADKRFSFIGNKSECQSFLDNVTYKANNNESTFRMKFTVSDGVLASYYNRVYWNSDATFESNNSFPDQSGTEEQDLVLNMPALSMTHPIEVNEFRYIITLDAIGTDGVTSTSVGTLANGVITGSYHATPSLMRVALDSTTLTFRDDFNDNFTFTITYEGRNTTVGSSYSSSELVNVAMTNANEFSNLFTAHSFTEDVRYNFADGQGLPNITHGYNRNFEARIFSNDANAIDVIWTSASGYNQGTDFFWENGNQLRMVGTRDQVNEMLNGVYFEPAIDYDQNFSLGYFQKRTSGDTTSDANNDDYYNIDIGSSNCITMTAIAHDEFSITQPSAIVWNEDVSKIFDSGLRITDLASGHEWTPSYQTDYRVEIALWIGATEFTDGTIVANTTTGLTVGGVGNQNGQGDTNMISYTGSKADINAALADLRFIPNVDFHGQGPEVYYKLVRVFDGSVLTNQAQNTKTTFATGTGHDEYSLPAVRQQYSSVADFSVVFDSSLRITDLSSENSDLATYNTNYEVTLVTKDTISNQAIQEVTLNTTNYGNATIGGTGNTLIITGNKSDINTALTNLKMIPDPDYYNTTGFRLEARIERVQDNALLLDYADESVVTFVVANANNYNISPTLTRDLTEETIDLYNTNVVISDNATQNSDYNNLFNTDYSVSLRLMYNDGTINQPLTSARIAYGVSDVNVNKSGIGHENDPLVLIGTRDYVNNALTLISVIPDPDFISSPASNGKFHIEARIERVQDNALLLDYTTVTTYNPSADLPEYLSSWQNLTYTEDLKNQTIFSGVTVVLDNAINVSYDPIYYRSTVTISNPIAGYFDFGNYVDTDYIDINYVIEGQHTVTLEGSNPAQINTAIQGLLFSANKDTNQSFDILYSQERYVNSVLDVVHASNVNVGTVTAIPVEEVTYSTANQNKQYFVGSDAEQTGTGPMHPRYFTESWGRTYQAPFQITDLYAETAGASEYNIAFTNASGLTLYDDTDTIIPNNIIDWDTREIVNQKIQNGIRIEGTGNANFALNFTVTRRTHSGIEDTIFNGSLNYVYLYGPQDYINHTVTTGFLNDNDTVHGISTVLNTVNIGSATFMLSDSDWTPPDGESLYNVLLPYSLDPFRIETPTGATALDYNNRPMFWSATDHTLNVTFGLATSAAPSVFIRDFECHMQWGVKYTIENIEFIVHAQNGRRLLSTLGRAYYTVNSTDNYTIRQTNWQDSTYIYMDDSGVSWSGWYKPEGVPPNYATLRSSRLPLVLRTDVLPSGNEYDRVLQDSAFSSTNSGITSETIGFRASQSGNQVTVEMGFKDFPSSEPTYTFTSPSSNSSGIHVTHIVSDSANNDIYLTILGEETAHIIKVNWNGTSATWTTVKSIDLSISGQYWSVEAFLSDTFDRLITVQSQWNSSTWAYTNFNGSNRIRVYDKDTGGTDNWGLTTTTNFSTSNTVSATKKFMNQHDVNYCDINGSDTVITNGGIVFEKDYNGINNWGQRTSLSSFVSFQGNISAAQGTPTIIMPRYTQDYIVIARGVTNPSSNQNHSSIAIYDKNTFQRLTEDYKIDDYGYGGNPSVRMLEATRQNNNVGLYTRMDYTATGTAGITMYQLRLTT